MIFKEQNNLNKSVDMHLYINNDLLDNLKEMQTVYKINKNKHLSISLLTNMAMYNFIEEIKGIATDDEELALDRIEELNNQLLKV